MRVRTVGHDSSPGRRARRARRPRLRRCGPGCGSCRIGSGTARRMTRSGESRRLSGGVNTRVAATVPIGRERAGVTAPDAATPVMSHRRARSEPRRRGLCLSADPDSPVGTAGECVWTVGGRCVSSAWAAQPTDIEMAWTGNATVGGAGAARTAHRPAALRDLCSVAARRAIPQSGMPDATSGGNAKMAARVGIIRAVTMSCGGFCDVGEGGSEGDLRSDNGDYRTSIH